MKVLWFSNSPGSAIEYLKGGSLGGGWLSALDKSIAQHVELHVAFYYVKYVEPFSYQGIFYDPICYQNWKWQLVKKIFYDKPIDKKDTAKYLKIIEDVKPDIIHILGTENPFGIIAQKTSIPVVVSIQGNITACTQKYFSGIEIKYSFKKDFSTAITFLTVKSFLANFKRFKKMSKIERRNLIYAKHIIGRTNWDKRLMSVMSPHANYYHNDEILRASFYENKWDAHNGDTIIIHTTNGNSIFKGFETICEALYELNQLGISVKWQVAGIKPNDVIVKIVKKKLKDRFPLKGLELLGGLSESQLIESLLVADIYVMPSHIENSPNSLCEAMILGMPCIATFTGGTGSMLKDAEEGILIQDGDPWAMAGAILELVKSPERACQYGLKARERALLRHDKMKIVDDLLKIYKQVILS